MMRMHNRTLWQRTAGVATFVGILAFTSACGSSDKFNTPVPETASDSASPTSIETTAPALVLPAGIGTPAPTGKLVTAPRGDYLQSVILPDDPAMKLIPATLDVSVQNLNPADVLEAQKTIVTFMAEQGIDSPVNGGGITADEWYAKNESKLSPSYKDEFHQDMNEGKAFVLNEKWQKEKYGDTYRYVTSPDKPRIYDREITPTNVWVVGNGSIAVKANVSYNIPAVPGVGFTGTGVQATSGSLSYSVTKDPATGQWLIDGYQNDINTTEG